MAYDSKVIIKILGDATNFDKAINGAEASLNSLRGVLAKLGLGASLGAVAKEVVTNTNALEDALSTASTLFGGVEVDMTTFQKKILALSSETGQSATAITNSLYNAFSSGIPVTEDMSEAIGFMETASKLAVAGLTDVDSAVDVLAKTMNAYGMSTDEVDKIAKNLVQTQNMGIVTVGELSQFLANVTPTASAYGISLEDVGASISVMTKAGTNASSATTNLNRVLLELVDNESETAKNLKKATKEVLGQEKSFKDLQNDGLNLQEVLLVLQQYADKAGLSIADLFSSSNAKSGAIQIAKDVQTYTDYMTAMESEANIVQESYDEMMATRSKAWGLLANRLKNITIKIGMGTGSQTLMDNVYSLAEDVVEKFEEWTPAINRALLTLSVGGSIAFSYLKDNLDKLPTYIVTAFGGAKIFSSIKSALGLSNLTSGAIGWAVALEVIDALDGTKSWEQVGKDCIKALAVGLGVGALFGTQAGGLAFALTMTIDPDFSDLTAKIGKELNRVLSGDETKAINPFDEAEAEGAIDTIGDYLGIVFERWFTTIGAMFEDMVNGDWTNVLTSFTDNAKLLGAQTMDFFLSFTKGKGYSEWTDQVRLGIARRDAPSSSQFSDGNLLRYLNEAEEKGVELETYLQSIIALQSEITPIDLSAVDTTTKATEEISAILPSVEEIKPQIEAIFVDVASEGLTEGTEEYIARAEELLKERFGDPKASLPAFNLGNYQKGISAGIDPTKIVTNTNKGLRKGVDGSYEVGYDMGDAVQEGTEDSLEIHSPAKTYEWIGEMTVAGLKKGMTESALDELKATLDTTYTEVGQDIMTWLSEGMKDGQTYTIVDAISDFIASTKLFNSLGSQIEGIEVKETGIVNLETGQTTEEIKQETTEAVEDTRTKWQKLLDGIKSGTSKVGDWLFSEVTFKNAEGKLESLGKTGLDVVNEVYTGLTSIAGYISNIISPIEQEISALESARDMAKKYNELSLEDEKAYDRQINALRKEQFEKGKRASIAQATIDTALSIAGIWAEWGKKPAIAWTLTALAGATLGAQVASIASQQASFEQGGLIGGHGYTGDKQQIWANAGELILNRTQQRAIADQLNYAGNTNVIQVEFSGNVFGDQQTIAEYVYDAIKTAQAKGAIRAW